MTTTRAMAVAAAGVTLLAWAGPARAVREVLAPTAQATITDTSGESRILVLFDGLTDLKDEWIQSATLDMPLSGSMPADVDVTIDVPRSQWSAGASWSAPWTQAGGDPYNEEAVVRTARAGGSGALSLDVTNLVRSMASGDMAENGFLIWPADAEREGFSSAELAAFGSRSQASLEITYRKLSAHFRVGAQELLARKRTASSDAPGAEKPRSSSRVGTAPRG